MKKTLTVFLLSLFITCLRGQVITLYDSNTKQSANFERTSKNVVLDGVINREKNGIYYKRILDDKINLKWFIDSSKTYYSHTSLIQKAIDLAISEDKTLYIPNGIYYIDSNGLDLKSNLRIEGESHNAVLLGDGNSYIASVNKFTEGSSDISLNKKNISIRNLTFESKIKTFSEHIHMLNINGGTDILVENCKFYSFRGDAVYIGSGNDAGLERHNKNIFIRNNYFDGVNYQNRNAVSIIDGQNILVENNFFSNTTYSNMPGAVDIEPDNHPFHIVKDIYIRNNSFYNVGGNIGVISVLIHKSTTNVDNIQITGNRIYDYQGTGSAIYINSNNTASEYSDIARKNITISDNFAFNGVNSRAFSLFNNNGVIFHNNIMKNFSTSSLIGYITEKNQNISFYSNYFEKIGYADEQGIWIFSVKNLSFISNHFKNMSSRINGKNFWIRYTQGFAERQIFDRNIFEFTEGTTAGYGIIMQGNTTELSKNKFRDNDTSTLLFDLFPYQN